MAIQMESHSHSFGLSCRHLQFTPKYRRKVFRDPVIKRACKGICSAVARELEIVLAAAEFGPDHMHIFLANCKHYSEVELANRFKGRISYEIRKRFAEKLIKFRLGKSFWNDGYFYETCGNVTAEARENYIKRGQLKHWIVVNHKGQTRLSSFTNCKKPPVL